MSPRPVYKHGEWRWWLINLPKYRYKRLMGMVERLHCAGKLPEPTMNLFDVWTI